MGALVIVPDLVLLTPLMKACPDLFSAEEAVVLRRWGVYRISELVNNRVISQNKICFTDKSYAIPGQLIYSLNLPRNHCDILG